MKPRLVRELLGEAFREQRIAQGRTLREVSLAARVSLGYLALHRREWVRGLNPPASSRDLAM